MWLGEYFLPWLVKMFQLSTYVNVEYPDQIEPVAEGKFYDVWIEQFNYTGKNFSVMEIMPCAL